MTEAEFCKLAQATMDKLIGQPVVLLDEVLLEEAHPMAQEHFKGLEEPSNKKAKVNKPVTGEYGVKHSAAFTAAGTDWWAPSAFRDDNAKE